MRVLLIFFLGITALYGAKNVQLSGKYKMIQKCKSFHMHFIKD